MLALLDNAQKIKELFILRKQKYNWKSNNIIKIKRITNTKITDFITAGEGREELKDEAAYASNEIEELDDTIAEYLAKEIGSKDIEDHTLLDTEKLTQVIDAILSNPKNWIVSNIKKEYDELLEVELKPLDVSSFCKAIFDRCSKTLVMSATILNSKAFCRNVGLKTDDIKFIQVQSDFPVENRPIHPLNIAYLSHNICNCKRQNPALQKQLIIS